MDTSEHTWTLDLGSMDDTENDTFEVEFDNSGYSFISAKEESGDAILTVDLLQVPQSGTVSVNFKVIETVVNSNKSFSRITLIPIQLSVYFDEEISQESTQTESATNNPTTSD